MNSEDYIRISKKLFDNLSKFGHTMDVSDRVDKVLKFREIEVLEEISQSLKSVAASLRGEK